MVDGGTSRPLEMIPCDTVNEKVSFQTFKRLGDGGERSPAMNEFFPPRTKHIREHVRESAYAVTSVPVWRF